MLRGHESFHNKCFGFYKNQYLPTICIMPVLLDQFVIILILLSSTFSRDWKELTQGNLKLWLLLSPEHGANNGGIREERAGRRVGVRGPPDHLPLDRLPSGGGCRDEKHDKDSPAPSWKTSP